MLDVCRFPYSLFYWSYQIVTRLLWIFCYWFELWKSRLHFEFSKYADVLPHLADLTYLIYLTNLTTYLNTYLLTPTLRPTNLHTYPPTCLLTYIYLPNSTPPSLCTSLHTQKLFPLKRQLIIATTFCSAVAPVSIFVSCKHFVCSCKYLFAGPFLLCFQWFCNVFQFCGDPQRCFFDLQPFVPANISDDLDDHANHRRNFSDDQDVHQSHPGIPHPSCTCTS